MAILVKMNEIKNKKRLKFELNKFSTIFTFLINMVIVKFIFELVNKIFNIYILLGDFEDLVIIILALISTYIYSKKRYLKKQYKDSSFTKLKIDNVLESNIIPKVLVNLNDENYILKNLSFKDRKGINNIDTVLINKIGAFIIYIKNDRGVITGNLEDSKWKLNLNGKVKKIQNPIFLAKKQRDRFKEYLKDNGYDINIIPIIYYNNKEIEVNLKYNVNEVAIFNGSGNENLIEYIKSYKSKNNISVEEILDIILKIKAK